jgi:hypothetical protein
MNRRRFLSVLAGLAWVPLARAGDWSAITAGEAGQALRESLNQGARAAIAKLGRENGFLDNPKVRIGLHKNLVKAERFMRFMGMGKQLDDLVLASNRAAEAAMAQAQGVVLSAVEKMSVDDARAILSGGEGAATAWFRRNTEAPLTEQLLPIVREVAGRSDLVRAYEALSAKVEQLAGGKSDIASVELFVTRKALEGLYTLIAEEERALRAHPMKFAGSLLGKVFSALE